MIALATMLAACGTAALAPVARHLHTPLPIPSDPAPTPTDTPAPAPTPSAAPVPVYAHAGGYTRSAPPSYPLIGHFDAPTVGVHIPVVSVGVVRGAMDAPEGPIGSMFWREGFWLRLGATPGTPGTATIAGHLDDYNGRPAAFWNIRYLHAGDEVDMTRQSDGALLRYQIVETDTWTLSQANQPGNLTRIYGGSNDGVSRLSLITCTGRWVNGEYDHRFVAFAVLQQ